MVHGHVNALGAQILGNFATVGHNMRLGCGEVIVHRDRVALVDERRENDVLAGAALVRWQEIFHAEQFGDLTF